MFLVLENTVISSLCRVRPSLRLLKREQSGAAQHCCCNLFSSSDMSFLQTMQSLHQSHEQYKRNCKVESISHVDLELETLLPSTQAMDELTSQHHQSAIPPYLPPYLLTFLLGIAMDGVSPIQ